MRAAEEGVGVVGRTRGVGIAWVEAYVHCFGRGEATLIVWGETVFCMTHTVCLVPPLAALVEEVSSHEEGNET